jgi:hypothetical protein
MSNPALDQFSNDLWWKVVPVVIVCGIAGLVLREVLQWLERKATQIGKARRAARKAQSAATAPAQYLGPAINDAPHCPACNAAMVKRKARRGVNAGSEFWGCSGYPRCRGTRAV